MVRLDRVVNIEENPIEEKRFYENDLGFSSIVDDSYKYWSKNNLPIRILANSLKKFIINHFSFAIAPKIGKLFFDGS